MMKLALTVALTLSHSLMNAEVRLTAPEAMKNAVKKLNPEYPAMAKQMKVTGKVEVEVTVAEDGSVADAKPMTGNPILTGSTVRSRKGWSFTPFTANGVPTKAVFVLAFDFRP